MDQQGPARRSAVIYFRWGRPKSKSHERNVPFFVARAATRVGCTARARRVLYATEVDLPARCCNMLEFCWMSYGVAIMPPRWPSHARCAVAAVVRMRLGCTHLLAQYLDLLGLEDLLFVANLHHLLLLLLQRVRHTTLGRKPKESPCRDATDLAEDWQ